MRNSIGNRLFASILLIFVLFAVSFVAFQYQREKKYRVDLLNTQLSEYNNHFAESLLQYTGEDTVDYCERFVVRHPVENLEVKVIREDSTTLFSTGELFNFYTLKSNFPNQKIVIISGLPYDLRLSDVLTTDKTYLYFAVLIMVILVIVLWRFTSRLGRNIENLELFSEKIDRNEAFNYEELANFSNDELGEIAERIVKIYKRLETTRGEQDRLKKELTHNIAHELKTPTACIIGYLETLINNEKIDEKKRQEFMVHSYNQARRLSSLIEDISVLNRMDEMNAQTYHFAPVNVNEIIDQVIAESAMRLEDRAMKISVNVPTSVVVSGDKALIYSIFRNLTDNSIAYAGVGTQIDINVLEREEAYLFTFSDDGVGVPAEHLDRLFERFYRVDKGRSRETGGTGLGLAIVKNAVLLHGGEIRAFRNGTKGLAMEFSLKK